MINRRWLPLNALRAFDAVGRHLSFTAGAQALHVSQSALSRHVISLEELLGVQLLERRPHGLVLTDAGARLLPVVHKAFDRLEQQINEIKRGGRQERTLRVHLPPSLLNKQAAPILRDFRREFPQIVLDISSSHVTGLPEQEIDLAVVYDRPGVDDTVTDLLWVTRVTPVCSPDVAARHAGKGLEQFLADNELLHVKLDGEPRELLWTIFARQSGALVDTNRGMAFDTAISAIQYAMLGDGVALCDVDMFAAEIAAGDLVAPYDLIFEDGYGYYLKFHSDDLADPDVALLRNWLIQRFAQATAAGRDPQPA